MKTNTFRALTLAGLFALCASAHASPFFWVIFG